MKRKIIILVVSYIFHKNDINFFKNNILIKKKKKKTELLTKSLILRGDFRYGSTSPADQSPVSHYCSFIIVVVFHDNLFFIIFVYNISFDSKLHEVSVTA